MTRPELVVLVAVSLAAVWAALCVVLNNRKSV